MLREAGRAVMRMEGWRKKRWGFSEQHDQGHIDRKPRLIFG